VEPLCEACQRCDFSRSLAGLPEKTESELIETGSVDLDPPQFGLIEIEMSKPVPGKTGLVHGLANACEPHFASKLGSSSLRSIARCR
jgi:hypothetical protein